MKLALLMCVAVGGRESAALTPAAPFDATLKKFKALVAGKKGPSTRMPELQLWTSSGVAKRHIFREFLEVPLATHSLDELKACVALQADEIAVLTEHVKTAAAKVVELEAKLSSGAEASGSHNSPSDKEAEKAPNASAGVVALGAASASGDGGNPPPGAGAGGDGTAAASSGSKSQKAARGGG